MTQQEQKPGKNNTASDQNKRAFFIKERKIKECGKKNSEDRQVRITIPEAADRFKQRKYSAKRFPVKDHDKKYCEASQNSLQPCGNFSGQKKCDQSGYGKSSAEQGNTSFFTDRAKNIIGQNSGQF